MRIVQVEWTAKVAACLSRMHDKVLAMALLAWRQTTKEKSEHRAILSGAVSVSAVRTMYIPMQLTHQDLSYVESPSQICTTN
jgi:hypothetical protein